MNNNNYYYSSDLALAAAIVATSTSKLSHIEDLGSQKSTFVFERSTELDMIVKLFWQKNLPVDCQTYFEALRYIKSRLYEERS